MILKSEKFLIIVIFIISISAALIIHGACLATEDEGVYVETGGNVGIGTTTPSCLLQLLKNGSAAPIRLDIHNTGSDDADDSILSFETEGLIEFGMGIDRSTGKFTITKGNVFGTDDYLTIDGSGNLGIGTTVSGGLLRLKNGTTFLDVDGSNNLTFTDSVTGTKTLAELDTHIDKAGIEGLGFVSGAHTVDTKLDKAGVESLGFVAGSHTVDTKLDKEGVEAMGFVTGDHTTDTDTHLDKAGVEALGFVAGQHTVDRNTQLTDTEIAGMGYLKKESDPKVGTNTANYVPKWNGTSLVTGTIIDNGSVGIGTDNPKGKLDVNGAIYQRGGRLHADYVFESDYTLESIREHADFMWENKHLKAVPRQKTDENGMEIIEVGSHRKGILEELEKAHIYIEQLHKQNRALEARLAKIETILGERK